MTATDFVAGMVRELLDFPADLLIEEREDDLGTLVTLRVNKEDMRTVIGRDGQTISSLRTLLRVYGGKKSQRVNLKLLEDDEIE
jgi:uncharacterized protein